MQTDGINTSCYTDQLSHGSIFQLLLTESQSISSQILSFPYVNPVPLFSSCYRDNVQPVVKYLTPSETITPLQNADRWKMQSIFSQNVKEIV